MASYSIKVGNVELVSVSDGFPIRLPLMLFPDTTIEQWREFPELLKEGDQIGSRWGTTVVRSAGKLIVVDTGLQAPDGILMEDMKAKGVQPEEVDFVVFTHLHPDHVGSGGGGTSADAVAEPHRTGAGGRCGEVQAGQRPVARRARHLHPAD